MCTFIILSKNVKRLRIERGWSQLTLAEKADIHINSVSRIERVDRRCSLTSLAKIASALKMPIQSLLTDQGGQYEEATKDFHA